MFLGLLQMKPHNDDNNDNGVGDRAMTVTMMAVMATAAVGTKTTAATAMAGDTDKYQLKAAAEETAPMAMGAVAATG
jgi:hypothetical protein